MGYNHDERLENYLENFLIREGFQSSYGLYHRIKNMRKLKRHLDTTTNTIHVFLTEYNYNEGDFDAEQVTTRLIKTIKEKKLWEDEHYYH